ncbi:MAG: hypothetical protein INQ03_02010 [Candidatus Heimdallarchaeota archaeon]|nr:hypothetical protein [Candidatus Heimdallarchaeota archaeon]
MNISPHDQHQRDLIRALQGSHSFKNHQETAISPINQYKGKTAYHVLDKYEDKFQIMKEIYCACGNKMIEADNLSYAQSDTVVNEHLMQCISCSNQEKVRFSMLKAALKAEVSEFKKPQYFPYR